MDLLQILKIRITLVIFIFLCFILYFALLALQSDLKPVKFLRLTRFHPADVILSATKLPKLSKTLHEGKNITCYFNDTTRNPFFELNEMDPVFGSAIFFYETSCPSESEKGDFQLNFRQACSIESALVAHPKNDVFLLVPRPIRVKLRKSQNLFVRELLKYQHFKIKHINFERFLKNTPMEKLYESGVILRSKWPMVHASDVLRFATLYKFGGLYLDLDVILLKPLMSNMSNFAAPESENNVGAGVIHFAQDKVGREMAVDCAEEISRTYSNTVWSYNSVGVMTRVLKRRCNAAKVADMTEERCKGFHVFPMAAFYPISFNDREIIFKVGKTDLLKSAISKSYAVHIWNAVSKNNKFTGPDVPYLQLAENYCPKIFNLYAENNGE